MAKPTNSQSTCGELQSLDQSNAWAFATGTLVPQLCSTDALTKTKSFEAIEWTAAFSSVHSLPLPNAEPSRLISTFQSPTAREGANAWFPPRWSLPQIPEHTRCPKFKPRCNLGKNTSGDPSQPPFPPHLLSLRLLHFNVVLPRRPSSSHSDIHSPSTRSWYLQRSLQIHPFQLRFHAFALPTPHPSLAPIQRRACNQRRCEPECPRLASITSINAVI